MQQQQPSSSSSPALESLPQVLLLKGEDQDGDVHDDPYVGSVLAALGAATVRVVPTLAFRARRDAVSAELRARVSEYPKSVVITSPRAVWGLDFVPHETHWARSVQRWFVVGQASHRAVKESKWFSREQHEIIGSESGSAEALLRLISSFEPSALTPIFFFSGNLRKPTIPQGLAKAFGEGLFREIVVYDTVPNESLNLPACEPKTKRILVLFSPSGVQAARKYVRPQNDFLIALGETTKQAILELGLICTLVAETPNVAGVTQAVVRLWTQV